MRRNRNSFSLKQSIAYSLLAHSLIMAAGSISFFIPRENDLSLTDVQIASDEELQNILNDYQLESPQTPPVEEIKQEEIKTIEEIREEIKAEETLKEEPVPQNPEPKPAEPETKKQEEIIPEPPQEVAKEPEPITEKQEETAKEEDVKEEEAVPKLEKIEEKPKEEIKVEEKKKPRKRNRKALMETIKRAEKKKAKEKNRKKILEIAEKASRKKKDVTFDKMLNGSINDLKKGIGQKRNGGGGSGFTGGTMVGDETVARIINDQIKPYWNVPSGIKDAEKLIIEIELQLDSSGEVIPSSVKIVDEKRYAMDYIFKAAADSARRAILEVGRFRIPHEKLEQEKEYRLKFNIADALREAGG
ncbi:MAG: hypothetical protein LBF54_03595 [Holosporaceae bacterium]|jgi:hypothetical protein|nr:hypothetical protein [Holosporaceae bacterium]